MAEIAQSDAGTRTIDRMMVRIEHLDKLLGLAGEVIITSSNLHDLQRELQETFTRQKALTVENLDALKASNEASRRISQDLHNLVMDIRLVEIGQTMRLFRRPVRDLARTLGRELDLQFLGEETLIDKALAERLVDPLLHLLRNAVDHGIEAPLERNRAGKPKEGTVRVEAIDREHHTEINITDDGRGIDEAAIREVAAENGHGNGEVPLLQILCAPGFSTAGSVTATSGRGVGLDLVRTVVDEFGGTITLETTPGQGSRFHLEIPKLRAVNIVDALTLRAGQRLYAFPIERVVSSLGIQAGEIESAMGASRYIRYLGDVVPLHDLQQLLGDAPLGEEEEPIPVVIVQGKPGKVALIVSEFLGPQKLVNVPLDDSVFKVRGVAGTSVFTGGRIGLTMEIDELVTLALEGTCEEPTWEVETGPEERTGLSAQATTTDHGAEEVEAVPAETPAKPKRSETVVLEKNDVSDLLDELIRSLAELQDVLLNLEATPGETEYLNDAFRRLHAAKGNFTMLEADDPAHVAHQLETILDYLRSDRLELTPERTDLLLDGVAYLDRAAKSLPAASPACPEELAGRLQPLVETEVAEKGAATESELIGLTFQLSPTEELQVLSALKRGEQTYETFLSFTPGRQADFLVAYLLLRRLGLHGTVLASLPPVGDIEQGNCGTAVKVLWSTPLDEGGVETLLQELTPLYGLQETQSMPTTIFQYRKA